MRRYTPLIPVITLLAGAFYLIGVGLREVFDPAS